MSVPVQTTSDSLCKLVRWAHSHGTICNLIPSLQHVSSGSHSNVLTPEPGPNGNTISLAVWGCGAGHAYHWPVGDHSNSCRTSANTSQGQERFVGGQTSSKVNFKVPGRQSCDLSCSEAASEGEEFSDRLFDIVGCDSSATDEDGDYAPCPSRKRSGSTGRAVGGKKIKQEPVSAADLDTIANIVNTRPAGTDTVNISQAFQGTKTHCQITHKPLPPCPQHQQDRQDRQDMMCERSVNSEMEMLRGDCVAVTTEQAERGSSATESTEQTAGGQNELERLRALLCAERNRNQQMSETISSLRLDKELLQFELTKKAELISDFLQDRLRPDKRLHHRSNQMEPGSSHMTSPDEVVEFDSQIQFDSFEEMETYSLERHQTLKSKRSRDGENTRVRMKNVVGVISRYMTALREFRCGVSMKVAFDRVGVDRNTISRTAAIAELSLAAPEVFQTLAPWDEKEETLAHYAHRCRQAMDDNIKAKIKTMKAKGELLPIVSK
ncbi:uncharacterized protein V6R79_018083 [Siganus canaliculatus]